MEVGFKCPIPHCNHEAPSLEIHHIDEVPSNNSFNNLIALCPTHHSMVTKNIIDRKSIKMMKQLLGGTFNNLGKSNQEFLSKREFQILSQDILSEKNFPFRTTFVGPMFLHPDWCFDLNQKKKSGVGYDRSIYRCLKNVDEEFSNQIKIICRNNKRYKKIIEDLIPQEKKDLFKTQIIERIDEIWHKDRLISPLICCVDTGYLQIPTIHEEALFLTWRKTELTPIGKTLVIRDSNLIKKHTEMFDDVFETCFHGLDIELDCLKSFIGEL